jgi:hypothetical protein
MRRSLLLLPFLAISLSVSAATFVVSSSNPTGPGTLQQAIVSANATPGRDQIVFTVTSATLPSLAGTFTDTVDIDGSSAPEGRVTITPDGFFDGSAGFTLDAGSSGSTLRNLSITADRPLFIGAGVTDVVVTRTEMDIGRGEVFILGDRIRLGGETQADANEIRILWLFTGTGAQVRNNFIGRVSVESGSNHLFADNFVTNLGAAGPGMVIERNSVDGFVDGSCIVIRSPADAPSIIRDNRTAACAVGIEVRGVAQVTGNDVRNSPIGIHVRPGFIPATATTLPTAGTVVSGNTVTATTTGIRIDPAATGVAITGNSLTGNGLPIDLGGNGPTANDPAPDPDTGANDLQNFPVLTSARLSPSQLVVEGTLTSAPSTPYQIELFSNAAADPEARTLLASFMVTTDATGVAAFTRGIASPLPVAGEAITATATNRGTAASPGNAPNSTSEVSAAVIVVMDPTAVIPTLSTWALLALAGVLAALVALRLR